MRRDKVLSKDNNTMPDSMNHSYQHLFAVNNYVSTSIEKYDNYN